MLIYHSPECNDYEQKGHPESPLRTLKTAELLKTNGLEFRIPERATEEDILRAHTQKHLESLKSRNFKDPDSPCYSKIYDLALLAAGSAITAMQNSILDKENTFSLMRPPGHHACRENVMGFCYLNNTAIATLHTLQLSGIEKVAVLDIDNHHGNGTQDILLGNNKTYFVDIHRHPDYPGTGEFSTGNCQNFPLPKNTTEKLYLETLSKGLEIIQKWKPDAMIVSAGFDTYKKDPVGGLGLDFSSYKKIGNLIGNLGLPICSILEGGYNVEALPECVLNYIWGIKNE
jgi:acetoin utilization deacetylase AcuC-like enzyme